MYKPILALRNRNKLILLFLLINIIITSGITSHVSAKSKAELYFDRAFFYYGKGEIDEAILYYKKSIELEPENVSAYNNIGLAVDIGWRLVK